MSPLELVTVIGGIGGYIAFVIAVIQWYFYVHSQRPKVSFSWPFHSAFENDLECYPFMISVPVLIRNCRQTAAAIVEVSCKVRCNGTDMEFVYVGSMIKATTKGVPEGAAVSVEDRPFFHIIIEPYGCRLVQINFAPKGSARLPDACEGKLHLRYQVLSKRRQGKLKIPFRIEPNREEK